MKTETQKNQENKALVWDYWQKLNYTDVDNVASVLLSAVHEDIKWNGSQPINQLHGADAQITDFWKPFLQCFPDVKRSPQILMGGIYKEEEWVSGTGYFTGTFVKDWLGIPATGEKANIFFGQFMVMRDGKIAESYLILDILSVMRQAGFQVLPPAKGAEGGKIPGPHSDDGILLTEQSVFESRKTAQLTSAMGEGMENYVRSRDGGNLKTMEQEHYWDPNMHWYGPSGIGSCFSLEEFGDFHQRPWLKGFGDRHLWKTSGGRYMGPFYEGKYGCGGVWDTPFSRHHGDYLGIPGTGKLMTLRDFDWYRRDGDYLSQNWVPIDMIDLLLQMDIDLFERMYAQIELRKRGNN